MKKGLLTAVSMLVCLLLAGTAFSGQIVTLKDAISHATVTDLNQDGININMGIEKVEISEILTERGGFSLLTFNGCARSQELGQPNLPLMNRLVSIPFGCELNVKVINFDTEEIKLSDYNIINPLMPVQPSVSKSDDPASIPFEYNDASYTSNSYYSLPLVKAKVLGTMRSVHLGLISISPVQYNPVENTLIIYKNIEVQITYNHPDWGATQEAKDKYYSPAFDAVFDNISNYSQQEKNSRADLVKYPIKYAIISHRMFEAQLQPFIEWKTKKGFNVVVAYTDVIGSTTSQVKAYLQGLYNAGTPEDPAPSFVLFVGDDQQIPAYTGYSGHISDLWMCEYTGDNFPEIYYGRFCAQSPSLLQPQSDKTLEYEQYLMPDPSYLAEVTLISGVDGTYASTYGNGQINYGTNYYFNAAHGIVDHTWLYPASNGSGVDAAIIQTVQDGIGLMNYTAHCGHTEQSNPNFNTADIATLTNNHMYLLGIGNCCQANTFGSDFGTTPCFGEAFLQKANGGAIGYIGGTNSTYWDEDYWWGVGNGPVVGAGPTYEQTGLGAYDGVFHDHGEALVNHHIYNDAIIFRGNLAVTEAGSSRTAYYWQIYCLMGDPSIMTYLGVPEVNNVSHPSALVFTSTTIAVDADPHSYVGISVNGVLHGAGFVDETGTVEIELVPFTQPDIADIVVTGQNKQPYTSTIQLFTPEGAYVVYNASSTNDVNGNDNGIAESGENILLGVELKNIGPDEALDVTATVTTTDGNFTMVDNTEVYGSIPGGDGTSFIADGFSFDVLPSTPDGYQATFDLSVTGTNRDLWTGTFKVEVHRPAVNYLTVTVNDVGNGDGVLDPGESAELIVTLSNSGTGQATNTTALLSESDAYVSVSDNYGTYGLLDAVSGTASNAGDSYLVAADGSCSPGHEMVFNLSVSADNGYTANLTFDFIVGDRMSFFVDDFSYDKGWIGLGGNAEWTIGPATGGSGSDGSGASDPLYDHTPTSDNGVLGNDLTPGIGGDYSNNLTTQYYVYSPVIDCGDFTSAQLTYYRCLGIESSDHVKLEVYNGTSWVSLFQNSSTINETAWSEQFYNISSYADGNNSFQIRFSLGTTDNS
ncbi:MAG: C25 family cysteine peptidase, partial [bacterium]